MSNKKYRCPFSKMMEYPSDDCGVMAFCEDCFYLKADKYSWHDLKENPKDVPEEDSRVLMRVDNKLNQYVCVTYHDGNFGLFARYVVLGWAYIPPFEGEE